MVHDTSKMASLCVLADGNINGVYCWLMYLDSTGISWTLSICLRGYPRNQQRVGSYLVLKDVQLEIDTEMLYTRSHRSTLGTNCLTSLRSVCKHRNRQRALNCLARYYCCWCSTILWPHDQWFVFVVYKRLGHLEIFFLVYGPHGLFYIKLRLFGSDLLEISVLFFLSSCSCSFLLYQVVVFLVLLFVRISDFSFSFLPFLPLFLFTLRIWMKFRRCWVALWLVRQFSDVMSTKYSCPGRLSKYRQ